MKGGKVAAAVTVTVTEERPEEKEMDLLLSEIPQVTSPQGHHGGAQGLAVHGAARHQGFVAAPRHQGFPARHHGEEACHAMLMNRRDDGGHQGGGGGGFHAPLRVWPTPLPPSGPFVGGPPSPLVDDPEKQWLANQLRGLFTEDAPTAPRGMPTPPVNNIPADVSAAHGSDYGYHFGAAGSSVHGETLFADQTRAAGYVTPPPHPFGVDVGLGGHGGFPANLDASMGGFVYNRTGNGTGIGWAQGLVHPGHAQAESFMLPAGQTGSEHNWGYVSTSPIALDPRGGPVRSTKLHCEYGVPVAGNRYTDMKGGFDQMEAFRCEDSQVFDGKKSMPFLKRGKDRRFQQHVSNRALELESPRMLRYENMVGVKGYIYFMAKDQNGCRFLQQKFEEGKHHVDVIFEGIIDHIAELMTNSFANYLVQKLLDVCDEEQRLRIIAVLTEDPVELLRISLNTHGTRAVQKC